MLLHLLEATIYLSELCFQALPLTSLYFLLSTCTIPTILGILGRANLNQPFTKFQQLHYFIQFYMEIDAKAQFYFILYIL